MHDVVSTGMNGPSRAAPGSRAARLDAAASAAPGREAGGAPPAPRSGDQVEVSVTARLMARLKAEPDIRADLVERVRGEIAEGKYETPERMDAALDQMIDESAAFDSAMGM